MKNIIPASRWIRVDYIVITPRHSLWCYADKDDDGRHGLLGCFRHGGRLYATDQFISRWSMSGFDHECKEYPAFIAGYDADGSIYNPYMIQISGDGDRVRLWVDA